MNNAAAALQVGWDPMEYLRLSGTDRIVADAVLAVALKQQAERRGHELEVQARSIGACVANNLARLFSSS